MERLMFESVFLGVVLLGMVWSYALALEKGVPWFDWNGQKRMQSRRQGRSPKTSLKMKKSSLFRHPISPASHSPTFKRLNELTRNREIAERLIQHVAQRHPDKTAEWCAEKAIYDLERDRMAR